MRVLEADDGRKRIRNGVWLLAAAGVLGAALVVGIARQAWEVATAVAAQPAAQPAAVAAAPPPRPAATAAVVTVPRRRAEPAAAQEEPAAVDEEGDEPPYTLPEPGAPPAGIALFPPPGTDPPKVGIVVPEGWPLPEGYVRHYQTTDDGEMLRAILMFHPDYEFLDARGEVIPLPPGLVVPPELAPPGMPIETLEIPAPRTGSDAAP